MHQPTEPNSTKRLHGVINAARMVHRFCDQKIGWGRIGVVLSIAIITIAAYVLYKILRGIELKEVGEALVLTDPRNIALAGAVRRRRLFHTDVLRPVCAAHVGRDDVPYRIAALADSPATRSATTSAPSVFTGGAVRYRIYSAWGLDAVDVAKICFVAGLTFWPATSTVLGLGIA